MGDRTGPACVVAVDLGTGGPKAAVVDHAGRVRGAAAHAVPTIHLADGGVEQDPEAMWQSVVDAVGAALAAAATDGGAARVQAITVTSQYMSTVPVAADGTPVGPCILWMDGRGGEYTPPLLTDDNFVRWLDRHGLFPLPSGHDGVAHILHLRHHRPEVYDAAAAFVEPMDYINARLTGRVQATQSTAFSLLSVDNRTWGATTHDPELVAAAGLDPDRLPPLAPLDAWAGELTTEAAGALGLPPGVPVTAGTIDSITSAVGTGALGPDAGSVVIGTTSVVVSHIPAKRGDLETGILSVPSPVPGQYYVMAENGVGGRALEWFLESVVFADDPLRPGRIPDDAYARAEAAAAAAPAGSDGLLFVPWLHGSIAPRPDDDVRAAWVNLGLTHRRTHLARAVLEGVALNAAWLVPHVETFVGHTFPFVRFGGGAALSDLWAQILADCLARPVHQLAEPRLTNARGAAFLALNQLGVIELSDVVSLLDVRSVRQPIEAHVPVYARLRAQLSAMHPPLAALPGVEP